MEPPIRLAGEARSFWDRHYRRLRKRGILTFSDLDSFAALCVCWAKLVQIGESPPGADNYREMVQYANLLKQYHSYAKQFGLLPRERRAAKMDADAPAKRDEFGL